MALTARLDRVWMVSQNAGFQQRIAAASIDQVATVVAEAGTVSDHANRLAYAALVAYDALRWARIMALGVIDTVPSIQTAITNDNPDTNNAAITDADIKTGVAAVWNFYADSAASLTAALKVV